MIQTPKFLQSSLQFLLPPKIQESPNSSLPISTIKQCCKVSRRDLTLKSNSLLFLLLGSQSLDPIFCLSYAQAEESTTSNISSIFSNKITTKNAFLDISIDGQPVGRIVIGLYGNDIPYGVDRFTRLVNGRGGVSYRKKEFVKIMPNYVQHGGVRSYSVDFEVARKTESNSGIDSLIGEWEKMNETFSGTKNLAGSVSIVVRDPSKPPPKLKLVARKGKLEIDEEEVGSDPNGTEFIIALKDSPELDDSALVVGKVLNGMEVVDKIGQVKTVKENTTSPYFRWVI